MRFRFSRLRLEDCKKNALILCDEIIKAFEDAGTKECETGHIIDYWQDIKTEINKL